MKVVYFFGIFVILALMQLDVECVEDYATYEADPPTTPEAEPVYTTTIAAIDPTTTNKHGEKVGCGGSIQIENVINNNYGKD